MRQRTITTSERDPTRREVSVWLPVRSGASFDEIVNAIMAELSAGAVGAYIELCIPSSRAELRAVESGDIAPGQAWMPPETPAPRVEPGPVVMPEEESTITIEEESEEDEEDEEDRRGSPGFELPDRPDDGGQYRGEFSMPDSFDTGPGPSPGGDRADVDDDLEPSAPSPEDRDFYGGDGGGGDYGGDILIDDFGPGDDTPDEEPLDFEPEDSGEDEGDERDEPVMWDENEEPPEDQSWEDYDFDGGPDFGEGAEDYEA